MRNNGCCNYWIKLIFDRYLVKVQTESPIDFGGTSISQSLLFIKSIFLGWKMGLSPIYIFETYLTALKSCNFCGCWQCLTLSRLLLFLIRGVISDFDPTEIKFGVIVQFDILKNFPKFGSDQLISHLPLTRTK